MSTVPEADFRIIYPAVTANLRAKSDADLIAHGLGLCAPECGYSDEAVPLCRELARRLAAANEAVESYIRAHGFAAEEARS